MEEIKESIIDNGTKFTMQTQSAKEILKFRLQNKEITQMCWITLRPVIGYCDTLHNPKALIMLILN